MVFQLIDIETNKHSQSWISILNIGSSNYLKHFNLFYIEWDYDKKVERLVILGIRLI